MQLEGHSKRCRISTVTLKNCPKVSQKRPVSHKMEYRYLYSTLVLLASWASMPSVRSAAVQHYQLANAWHCRASTPAAAVPYCGLPFAATNSYGEHLPECWFDPFPLLKGTTGIPAGMAPNLAMAACRLVSL